MTTRREFLGYAAGLGSSVALASLASFARAAGTLVVKEAGGASGDAVKKAYSDPFSAKTGVAVSQQSPSPNVGFVKTMLRSGDFSVHVMEVADSDFPVMKNEDLLEEIDWKAVNPDPTYEDAIDTHGLAWSYYSTVMAWRADQKPLESWIDFWDVEKFPGARALPDYPEFMLPQALLADGVAMESLFPLDLDRAFASLDKIKEHVPVWWSAGAQPVQLLRDNEVQYASAWNGRVFGDDALGYTFKGGQLNSSYFCIPKGLPQDLKDHAFAFLHEVSIAKNQGTYASLIPYTGPAKDLQKFLPQDMLSAFPTTPENKAVQFVSLPSWWAEHGVEANRRWEQFKLTR